MTALHRTEARRGEEGSALVLALVFISVLGVFIGAVLSFGSTSFRTTIAVREQRDVVYAADGAVDGAINAIRSNAALGKDGGSCPDFVAPFYETDSSRTKSVTVTCSGLLGSGASVGGTSSPINMPGQAVLTLAASGEDGLVQSSNNELRVRGNVVSNTTVHVPVAGASLTVDGAVTTKEGCTGNGTVSPACTADPSASVADPGYGKRSDAPATPGPYRNLDDQKAQCAAAGSTVTFRPGLYTDAVGLSDLTRATGGSCPNSLFWFEPGVYYFDFANAGSHEWKISGNGTMVVGGEPNGWTPATPKPAVPFPGGCKTADDGGTDGVQFVFGGDSRVFVQDATFELCAKPSADAQQIAVYGMPSGATPAEATTALVPTTNPANSSPGFSAPSNAYAIGETPTRSTADFGATSPSANVTGSVSLAGFGLGAVPAGSRITKVLARVAHEESGSVDALQMTVTSSQRSEVITSGGACNANKLCTGAYRTQEFDVTSAFPTTDVLTTASVKYDATIRRSATGTAKLDGVALVVTYVSPAYRALSGCLVALPYVAPGGSDSAPCPNATSPASLLTSRGSPTGISIVGTVYAPTAALDIQLTNASAQVVRRGVVARTIRVVVTSSSTFTGNAIELPAGSASPPADRKVLFTAQVGSITRLRAVVTFGDGGGVTPGQVVKVEEWSVRR